MAAQARMDFLDEYKVILFQYYPYYVFVCLIGFIRWPGS